jgi:8-oxo-dGTP pyrophosphatase MutT (NUDIX family)
LWLPCGGHVEPNELPDDAAVRETFEESGVLVDLVGERTVDVSGPTALVRPRGVQLEPIEPGHEHVDLIYFAVPQEPYDGRLPRRETDPSLGWYDEPALRRLDLTAEVRAWCALALAELAGPGPASVQATPMSRSTVA